ncbi:MAG: TonB-dependent receptor, partial [Sphingomonadales bacterium]|nr:TonB-dependent receptor [Sphingomonadales bacterium]
TGAQKAKNIVSNQFFFDQTELNYISNHYIYTDHSQRWTISGGGALNIRDRFGRFQPSFDFIYGDGLRAGDPAGVVPNGGKQSPYLQANLGLAQVFGDGDEKNLTVRIDVVNLFDKIYLIHDGSGVGAGQPEWGPRRAFFIGVRKAF